MVKNVSQSFYYWSEYFGELYTDCFDGNTSIVYGFNSESPDASGNQIVIPQRGGCFGCIVQGSAEITGLLNLENPTVLTAGSYFSSVNGLDVKLGQNTNMLVIQSVGYLGRALAGGPIEKKGRLKYIDGCSDALLIAPPIIGDPCFNHLHFPPGMDQTSHTHPSLRAGIVARGQGKCESIDLKWDLQLGGIFVIPRDGLHRFSTAASLDSLDVMVYHPDSDHGPSHENHPMINRTWVEGKKIDNNTSQHRDADFVIGRGSIDTVSD